MILVVLILGLLLFFEKEAAVERHPGKIDFVFLFFYYQETKTQIDKW